MKVTDRLKGKTAVIIGAGQTPGETVGNGRAAAVLFARAGAKVLCVDRVFERAQDTATQIVDEGGSASAIAADVRKAEDCSAAIADAHERWGRIDILINNVGIGGRGDGPAHRLEESALDLILDVNLKGAWRTIAAALPGMREQGGGAIVNISSLASIAGGFQTAYEVSKAALNRLTTSVASANAGKGIRCNAIMPGLMDTPMAVAGIAQVSGVDVETVRAERNKRVPLGGKMGSAWDTAYAALFLASDEAGFITGAIVPVDGGASVRIG
ncbi:MAG: SDR family oxidoreductase [Spongiibacteraceae bacterium]|nr:SDR family oxidoreductase [Spongiibacteraceae bacterium]